MYSEHVGQSLPPLVKSLVGLYRQVFWTQGCIYIFIPPPKSIYMLDSCWFIDYVIESPFQKYVASMHLVNQGALERGCCFKCNWWPSTNMCVCVYIIYIRRYCLWVRRNMQPYLDIFGKLMLRPHDEWGCSNNMLFWFMFLTTKACHYVRPN